MTSTSNPDISSSESRNIEVADKQEHMQRVLIGKKQILVTENESLLVQLERAGINMEYQCREGYCSSCSIKLIWGNVVYPYEPLAWVQSGYMLACCAIVKSDIEIEFL